MKKILLFIFISIFFISTKAQSNHGIIGDWELVEINHYGTLIEAPSNSEVDRILMRYYFEIDVFVFETRMCGSINGLTFPNSNDFILIPIGVSNEPCILNENQEFQELYFQFYLEDTNGLHTYTVVEDLGSNLRELIITNSVGNTATYISYLLNAGDLEELSFIIYPNPASETLYIQNQSAPIDSYMILDVTGKIIQRGNEVTDTITISELSAGIYFLEISSEGKRAIKKFVKK